MFGIEYYPTPKELAEYLINDIDFLKYKATTINVLEPSAGDGNLIEVLYETCKNFWNDTIEKRNCHKNKLLKKYKLKELYQPNRLDIDCIEIDNDLQNVLRGKGFKVIADNFLNSKIFKEYDLIIMNPPFSNGELHLLKAIKIMKNGGSIRCILNAETIKNPYSNTRKLLIQKLEQLNARIEYQEKAFNNSERKTNVEIAIIRINIVPNINPIESDIFNYLQKDILEEETIEKELFKTNEVTFRNDIIDNLIQRYNEEVALSTKIIKEFDTLIPLITTDFSEGSEPILKLSINADKIIDYSHISSQDIEKQLTTKGKINTCIKVIRKKYWYTMFEQKELRNLMTTSIKESYQRNLYKMCDYDFNKNNIFQIKYELSKNLLSNMKDSILEWFDFLTKYHMDDFSSNIHYFNGWKTNKSYYINKKVIIPNRSIICYNGTFNIYTLRDTLENLEKIFGYLNNNYDEVKGNFKRSIVDSINEYDNTNNELYGKYFIIRLYKKGTYHIIFNDLELLKKFNLYACKEKGWLPYDYGTKKYESLSREEKDIVDSFEGSKSYNNIFMNQNYYLSVNASNVLMLENFKINN